MGLAFFFSSRRRHTRWPRDWSSDVCSSDLAADRPGLAIARPCTKHRGVNPAMNGFPVAWPCPGGSAKIEVGRQRSRWVNRERGEELKMDGKVRLGIIGLGVQGAVYARMIAAGEAGDLVVTAVADVDEDARARAQEVSPGATFFTDYRDLLASGEVDAVVTTTPHYLHPEIGIAAIRAGVHVLVDKPAGVYTAQVRELNDAAAAHPDVVFAIMFNQRNNPLYQRIKQIVDDGEIGAIRRSNWLITTWWRPDAYYAASEWRATWGGDGGGVMVNQATHPLDQLQRICGMPKS